MEVANEAAKTPEQHRMCYWGYKFETYATVGDEAPEQPPELRTAYCTIAKAGLGRHTLILCGEVLHETRF